MNPFRNSIRTFDLLPKDLQPRLLPALEFDWRDLESNGNPIEHEPATDQASAIDYIDEWQEDPYDFVNTAAQRQLLLDLADVYDRCLIHLPADDETTFAGEHVASGQYMSIRECEWPDYRPETWEGFDHEYTVRLTFMIPPEYDPIAAPDGLNSDPRETYKTFIAVIRHHAVDHFFLVPTIKEG